MNFQLRKNALTKGLRPRHIVLLCLLLAATLFRLSPSLGGTYTAYVYPALAHLVAPVTGAIPLAVGDIFIALSIAWVVGYPPFAVLIRKKPLRPTLLRVAEYLLWLYVWFYAAWGINYAQPDIFHRLHMPRAEVRADAFQAFAERYADSLNASYCPIVRKPEERAMRQMAIQGYSHLRSMGVNQPFAPGARAKTMLFSRLSSMAGITGSMGPFFCEFTINADVRPHDYPATYAHEYAHLLGIANEGEANFYSYLVCTSATSRAVRFSGYYLIFFHVLQGVRNILGHKAYEAYLHRLRPEVIRLAKADRRYWQSLRCPIIDKAQTFLYDLYLRGNHVEGGTRSYSTVIAIIMSWEEKNNTDHQRINGNSDNRRQPFTEKQKRL